MAKALSWVMREMHRSVRNCPSLWSVYSSSRDLRHMYTAKPVQMLGLRVSTRDVQVRPCINGFQMRGVYTQREQWKRLQGSTSPTLSFYRLGSTCWLPVNKHEGGSRASCGSCEESIHEIEEMVYFPLRGKEQN